MVKEHLLLREHSGKSWLHGSLAREYLEKLPLANAEDNFRETDTRYLLSRDNIFTFGLKNGIKERVIYYTCNMCHAFIKPHEVKNHMITKHAKQDGNSTSCSNQSTPTPLITSKSKKSSHKSKKKVVPPPSVPPPPLFPKIEITPPSTVTPSSTSEDILPPVLQPVETVDTKISSSHKSSEKSEETAKPTTTVAVTTTTATTTANTTTPLVTTTTTPSAVTTSVDSVTTMASSTSNEPPITTTAVITKKPIVTTTDSPSKTKEKSSSKSERDSYKRKRSKRSKSSDDFDPNRHCGVLDSMKRPCMRTLTCANHTIIERRAVAGRSKNVDKLILEYKATRVKNKLQPAMPITIAPKQCSSLKEVRNGLRVIELIYGNDNQNNLGNSDFKCPDDPIMSSVLENLTSITHRVPKALKPSSFYVPPTPEMEQVARVTKLPPVTFLKVNLSQSSPPLPGTKVAEVPSQTPTLYSAHPKPMTMLTTPLRRVGSSFVLQQQAQRLDRQRLDLSAVVNQHKQLKIASPNKQVSLLNSNHNKQSILKSNIKNNVKTNPLKRPAVEKTSNDIKHMKLISNDMNGFILNTEFTDNNETQANNTVQDKIALLK